jgi:hypothetical protein
MDYLKRRVSQRRGLHPKGTMRPIPLHFPLALLIAFLLGCGPAVDKELANTLRKAGTEAAIRHLDSPQVTSESMRAAIRKRWDQVLTERTKEQVQEKVTDAAFDAMMQPFDDAWTKCKDRPDLDAIKGCVATELNRPQ